MAHRPDKVQQFQSIEAILRAEYETGNMTIEQIAKQYHYTPNQLLYVKRMHSIERQAKPNPREMGKEWFHTQYIQKNKTADQIAKKLGCSRKTVALILKEFDIYKSKQAIIDSYRKPNGV